MKELSVIIPVLNEAETVPELLRTLAEQQGVDAEVVICDGGSRDGTVETALRLAPELPYPLRIVESEAGRARQMNEGAAACTGEHLLFLHADSFFPDRLALRTAMDALSAAIAARGDDRVAGRFSLRFDTTPSPAYYHLECKARLNRPECIHGDQGFLMGRRFFAEIGPFDDSLPMLAETRLAEAVRHRGNWTLLPADIRTSPRRFDAEGFRERYALDALIMNFAAAGWEPFFRELPRIYADQQAARRLDLRLILRQTGELMARSPRRERLDLWRATGRYVRNNAWQIALALDTRRNFRRGLPPGEGDMPVLACYDRFLDRLTDHPPGRAAAALLTWFWYRLAQCRKQG